MDEPLVFWLDVDRPDATGYSAAVDVSPREEVSGPGQEAADLDRVISSV